MGLHIPIYGSRMGVPPPPPPATHLPPPRQPLAPLPHPDTHLLTLGAVLPLGVHVVIRDDGAPRYVVVNGGTLVIRVPLVGEGKHTAHVGVNCLGSILAMSNAVLPLVIHVVIRDGGAPGSVVVNVGALVIRFSLVDEGENAADAFSLCLGSFFTSLRLRRSGCWGCGWGCGGRRWASYYRIYSSGAYQIFCDAGAALI